MSLARRTEAIEPFLAVEVAERAQQLEQQGVDVVHLGYGEPDFAPPGAESFTAMQRRLLPVWERLTREHEGRTAVVVAHGMVKRVLLLSLLGWGVGNWKRVGTTHNVGVCELIHAGGAGR